MSGTSTPSTAQEREQHLLSIGRQCSAPHCHLVDFLPFQCQHCHQPYCADHFKPDGHSCDKFDESKVNRVAPSCPMCNEVISIPPGQDPNIRMERHFRDDCSVMTGKTKVKAKPVCGHVKCNKVMFAPISCDKCRKQFCPQHRFPNTHDCSSLKSAASKPAAAAPSSSKPSTPAHTSAMAAIKRTVAQASSSSTSSTPSRPLQSHSQPKPTPVSTASTSSPSKSTPNNVAAALGKPFNKTDKSLTAPPPNATTTIDTEPPATCTPKPPSTSLNRSLFDFGSFAPPPVFAAA